VRAVHPSLLALATVTRRAAQTTIARSQVIQFVSLLLCSWAVLQNQVIAWLMVVLGFALKVVSLVMNAKGEQQHILSREAQRLALLEDSLGQPLNAFQVVEVRRMLGPKLEAKARSASHDQPYYRSHEPPGPSRLRESIQQSTFWSRHLLEFYATRIRRTIITGLSLVAASVYLLLVLSSSGSPIVVNPYLLSLAAFTLAMGILDYIRVYVGCKRSAELLFAVDERLDRVDVEAMDTLLANFADYSIASVTAPPIPYGIYTTHRPYLIELWDQRQSGQSSIPPVRLVEGYSPTIVLDENALPAHISRERLLDLLRQVAVTLSEQSGKQQLPTSVAVARLPGLSGTPVLEIQFFQGSRLWRQLVLRLHESVAAARRELEAVKKISSENVELLTYRPIEEPFISQGALFYYHANIQTNDELLHADDFAEQFFRGDLADFEGHFERFLEGLRSLSKAYDAVSDYSVMPVSEMLPKFLENVPPSYVIDLRTMALELEGTSVRIPVKGRFPKKPEKVLETLDDPLVDRCVQVNCEVLGISNYYGSVYEVDIVLLNGRCRILLDGAQAAQIMPHLGARLELLFVPRDCLQSLTTFFMARYDINLDRFHPQECLLEFNSAFGKQALHLAFRHRDLHCRNCLVSRSNFKLIDVGDSTEAMSCADVARMEISILSQMTHKLGLGNHDVLRLLTLTEKHENATPSSDKVGYLADLVRRMRYSMLTGLKIVPSEVEEVLSYYVECCEQLSCSIASPMGFRPSSSLLIMYWQERLLSLVKKD